MAARWTTALGIAAALAVTAAQGATRARAQECFRFRVDTTTGKVRPVGQTRTTCSGDRAPAGTAGSARLKPAARVTERANLSGENGVAILYERGGKERIRIPMSDGKNDWSPWHVLQGDLLIFEWRSEVKGAKPGTLHDVWTAVDVRDGRTLWRRDNPVWERRSAASLNDHAIVVDGAKQVEILDSRSGKTLRALAKNERWFSMTDLPDGLLVEAGDDLHLVDRATGDSRWRVGKRGFLISWTPVPKADRALLQTHHGVTALVDTRAGKILWEKTSSSEDELWVLGDRIYEPALEHRGIEHAIVRLIERRLADGAAVRTTLVQDFRQFFEVSRTTITDVRDGHVDLENEFGHYE